MLYKETIHVCMKIKWWTAAPKNGYMYLVVIWWYKSTCERAFFGFLLFIGNLDVSLVDLAVYFRQSKVTSHLCESTFVGGPGHGPQEFCRNIWVSTDVQLGSGIAREGGKPSPSQWSPRPFSWKVCIRGEIWRGGVHVLSNVSNPIIKLQKHIDERLAGMS